MKKFKTSLIISTLFVILLNLCSTQTKADPPWRVPQVAVSFQFFYDNLSPYGTWVSYPGYGYAWRPAMEVGFRPYYTGGHWVFTDEGWMWASDYDWGWAPFHYGTWMMDPIYGWIWVPGYDWAPAWVTWGYYDGYYGWAPCAPGFSISVGYRPPMEYWVFAHPGHLMRDDWRHYAYPASGQRVNISNNTYITNVQRINVVNNTAGRGGSTYFAGPRRQEFEQNTRQNIQQVPVREAARPGRAELSGNAVNVYRPQVTKMEDARPARVARVEDLKPVNNQRTQPAVNGNAGRPAPTTQPQVQPRQSGQQVQPNQQPRNIQTPRQQTQPAPATRQVQPQQQPAPRVQPRSEQPRQIQEQPRPAEQPRQIQREQQRAPEMSRPQPQPQQQRQAAPQRQSRQMQRQPRQSAPREMGRPPMQPQPQGPPMQQGQPERGHGGGRR